MQKRVLRRGVATLLREAKFSASSGIANSRVPAKKFRPRPPSAVVHGTPPPCDWFRFLRARVEAALFPQAADDNRVETSISSTSSANRLRARTHE